MQFILLQPWKWIYMREKESAEDFFFNLTSSLWPHNSPKTRTSNSIWRWGMCSQNKLFSLLALGWISYSEYLAWPPRLKRRGGMDMRAFSFFPLEFQMRKQTVSEATLQARSPALNCFLCTFEKPHKCNKANFFTLDWLLRRAHCAISTVV